MKPNYCPNCGIVLKGENSTVGIQFFDGSGYDCYCKHCKWSGDIWPDDEAADHKVYLKNAEETWQKSVNIAREVYQQAIDEAKKTWDEAKSKAYKDYLGNKRRD